MAQEYENTRYGSKADFIGPIQATISRVLRGVSLSRRAIVVTRQRQPLRAQPVDWRTLFGQVRIELDGIEPFGRHPDRLSQRIPARVIVQVSEYRDEHTEANLSKVSFGE